MTFKFTSLAPKIFLRVFYTHVFAVKWIDMLGAVRHGRNALATYPTWVGRLNIRVELPDYFVPVLYCAEMIQSRETIFDYNPPIDLSTEGQEEIRQQLIRQEGLDFESRQKERYSLIGREQDILELEWLLLRSTDSNIIGLIGMVGAGKTALVKSLGAWWHQSRMVSHVSYQDLRQIPVSDIIKHIQDRHKSSSLEEDDDRHIMILDHLDAIMSLFGNALTPMTASERKQLIPLIQSYQGRRDLLILVSRSQENWFNLSKRQTYSLGVLTSYHAAAFSSQIISEMGMSEISLTVITLTILNISRAGSITTRFPSKYL